MVVEEDAEENKEAEEQFEDAPDPAAAAPCSREEEQDLAPEAGDPEEDLLEQEGEEQFVAPDPDPDQWAGI